MASRWFMIGLMSLVLMGARAAAAEVLVGAASETLQLPARVPLAGYSRRKGKPSLGVHDPLRVRALVFDDGRTTAAIVSCELLMIDESLAAAVRRRLAGHGLGHLQTVLAATHTHSGPGAYGARFLEKLSMGHFDPAVFEEIVTRIVRSIQRAHEAMAPARLAYQRSATEGLVTNRIEAGGLLEQDVRVVAFYHEREPPVAVLVSFAAHPTTLGAGNRELSGDYPGVLMREVERRLPQTTCLFFAGPVGDQAPIKQGGGFEPAQRLGQALADHVIGLLAHMRPTAPSALAAAHEVMPLPSAALRIGRLTLPRWLGARFVDDDASLSLLAVGDALWLGVPCDITTLLGRRLDEAAAARGFQPTVVGFANDYIGYCVPRELYEQRQYESAMAFNGPLAGEQVVERLIEMMDRLSGDPVTR